MNILDIFRVFTPAAISCVIIAGIITSLIYWRNIKISFYNGIAFNITFFLAMFIARFALDQNPAAAGWIGAYLLYLLFMVSAFMTKLTWERVFDKKYK